MGELDVHLWCQGNHFRAYEKLGAHVTEEGARFAVWAPNAQRVSVIGDFNGWNPGLHPLWLDRATGIWEGFVAGAHVGQGYKFWIQAAGGQPTERCDPYGYFAENRPRTASRLWDLERYRWGDEEWMRSRGAAPIHEQPVNIYEVHLGSWMRDIFHNRWMSYREVAPRLAEYCRNMGYTHVELLPVTEHPYDGSWGYQVTGYFAPTSRYGNPDDFRFLVDTLHQAGVGVILDWVPAHFPRDGHALAFFDGTHLYEHADWRKGAHPDWGTLIFNYGRHEVRNFLISSALFWLDEFHVDGLRVDAVASMLYLDYGRKHGEWVPNPFGGRENDDAVAFLKTFNHAVRQNYPDVFTLAEESTAWPLVSAPAEDGGLGFTFKWNMGWMHDTLEYISKDPIHRKYHHRNLTFAMMYQYSEKYVLPFSHDEVVHLKKAMLSKMPGDLWQQFANMRLLLGYKAGFPGKKLLFMGGEFGQWDEWNHEKELDWHLLRFDQHRQLSEWVRDLNRLVRDEAGLHQLDHHPDGFEWIDCDDWQASQVAFLRFPRGRGEAFLFLANFTPVPHQARRVGLPWGGEWTPVLCSDWQRYGGSGLGNTLPVTADQAECHGRPWSGAFEVPPLGVLILRGIRPEEPPAEPPTPAPDEPRSQTSS
ncbi:MAG: 1,4-alpha-glucan branching protein GlgB [Candidatus Eremiobacterota bacterium]